MQGLKPTQGLPLDSATPASIKVMVEDQLNYLAQKHCLQLP